jgi:hypothetical protein
MAATNKRLHISESHGDSNRCTPCRGKSDQHNTYASHASPRMSGVRFLWVVLVCGNLSQVIISVGRTLLPSRKRAPDTTPSLAEWSTGPPPSFSPNIASEAVMKAKHLLTNKLHRFTGPITPACDQYAQYLLTGTNLSVLNWHRRWLPHRNLEIATTLSPQFPSECSTGPLNGPTQSPFYQILISNNSECISTYCRHVVFQPLGTYRQLYLRLANSNDL